MHGDDSRNLRLSFEHREGRDYLVTAALGDGTPVTSVFTVPLTDEQLDEVLGTLGETRSLTTDTAPDVPGDVTRAATIVPQRKATAEEFGTKLADALLAGDVGALFDRARAQGDVQLRLVLTEDQTELLRIPWEFLCRRGIFIAAQPQTPVLRELWTDDVQTFEPEVPAKIRILAVSASPAGHEVLDTAGEQARIRAVVADHSDVAELAWIDDCTFDKLHAALDTTPHVLHFVGHSFCDDNGAAGLILTRDDGSAHQVSALAFANLIGRAESLQLVVLNSCEGFRAVDGQPYASLAAKLVRVGRSAVIAMQFKITDGAAIRFAEELYKRIVVDRVGIDRAVSEARIAVMGVNEMEFATPVLYLRDGNAALFGDSDGPGESAVVARAMRVSGTPRATTHLGDRVLRLASPPLIGDDVAELQERLHDAGIDAGPVDGLFGERTLGALEAFQERAGLPVDGICGPATIEALGRPPATTPEPVVTSVEPTTSPPPSPPRAAATQPPVAMPEAGAPPTQPARGSTRRGVLIGIAVTVVAVIGFLIAIGDDPEDSTANGAAVVGTTVTTASGPAAVTTPPTAETAATVAPVEVSTTAAELTPQQLFGITSYFPTINGPTYVVDPEVLDPGATDGCAEARRRRAVVVSESGSASVASITLQAKAALRRSETAVALTGVSIEVESWQPPAVGVLFSCPGLPLTDGPPPILVKAALPSAQGENAVLSYETFAVGSGSAVSVSRRSFPRQVLEPRETMFFDLAVDSGGCECTWFVVLDMVIDGEPTRIKVGDAGGRPFHTTGSANAASSASAAS